MSAANKGAVTALTITNIATEEGSGIQGGDVLIVRGPAPDVRIVGLDAAGVRQVTPNLLTVAPASLLASFMPLLSSTTVILTDGAVNEVLAEIELKFGPNGDPAPVGTSVLVAYVCSAGVLVTLAPGSAPNSSLVGQAVLTNQGLVWARVGDDGTVTLLFTATAGDNLSVTAQQSAGLGVASTQARVVP